MANYEAIQIALEEFLPNNILNSEFHNTHKIDIENYQSFLWNNL